MREGRPGRPRFQAQPRRTLCSARRRRAAVAAGAVQLLSMAAAGGIRTGTTQRGAAVIWGRRRPAGASRRLRERAPSRGAGGTRHRSLWMRRLGRGAGFKAAAWSSAVPGGDRGAIGRQRSKPATAEGMQGRPARPARRRCSGPCPRPAHRPPAPLLRGADRLSSRAGASRSCRRRRAASPSGTSA